MEKHYLAKQLILLLIIIATAFSLGMSFAEAKVIRVAVIDTGFNMENKYTWDIPLCKKHYDFREKKPQLAKDYIGHGTQMAAIIARRAGVEAKYCIISINYHTFPYMNAGVVAQAIEKAIKMKAHVINMSLEGHRHHQLEHNALLKAGKKGIRMFVAAGNARHSVYTSGGKGINLNEKCNVYPACYRDVRHLTAVGALDNIGQIASYSNYGRFLTWYPGRALGGKGTSIATALATGSYVKYLDEKWNKRGRNK